MNNTIGMTRCGDKKHLCVTKYELNEKKYPFTNQDMMNMLIKSQEFRYLYPHLKLCCVIPNELYDDEKIYRIFSSTFDYVLNNYEYNDKTIIKKMVDKYGFVKHMDIDYVINENNFDMEYDYYALKKNIGPIISNEFMFKERDIIIEQYGGFNFKKNKIAFKNKEDDPRMKTIVELYNYEKSDVKSFHLKYYHTIKNAQYRPYHLKTMFDNVDVYDYASVMERLSDYYEGKCYYEELHQKYNKILINAKKDKMRLDMIENIDQKDKDCIITQYIKCRHNAFVLSIWKPVLKTSTINDFVTFLEKHGNVYYVKQELFTRKALKNLLFWMYDDFTYSQRLSFIDKKLDYIDTEEKDNPVCFIIFDNIHNKKLSGQGSDFKRELRNVLLKLSGLDTEKYRGNDLIHINDYFYQTVEYSEMLFNQNTIDVLHKQDCMIFANEEYDLCNLKLQTFRKILYTDLSLLEIDRLIIIGGVMMYAHGMRRFNDIDTMWIDNNSDSSRLIRYVENFFIHKKSKFPFVDSGIQGSTHWKQSWTDEDQNILNKMNIKNFNHLALNPSCFFYHQGVKIVLVEYEMIRKIIRNRTEDHIDFVMLNLLNPSMISPFIDLNMINESDITESNTNEKLFLINEKYSDIAGKYNNKLDHLKNKILRRRYTESQINKVSNENIFIKYFSD
jgi:hypothetical protein